MSNGCNIAQKDSKGDTVKDNIQRYMFKDSKFVNLYVKYENRILINRMYETQSSSFGQFVENVQMNFRWNRPFFWEFIKISYRSLMARHRIKVLIASYVFLYLFHWIFVVGGTFVQNVVTMLFHIVLIAIAIILVWFMKSDSGYIEKRHITKHRESNLIG
jgi:hypothetical protein